MADPHASSAAVTITAAAMYFLGPLAGEYIVIVAFGFAGALFALDIRENLSWWRSAWMVFRGTALAVAASSFVARQLELRANFSSHEVLGLVAFLLAAKGDAILDFGLNAVRSKMGGSTKPPQPPQGGA